MCEFSMTYCTWSGAPSDMFSCHRCCWISINPAYLCDSFMKQVGSCTSSVLGHTQPGHFSKCSSYSVWALKCLCLHLWVGGHMCYLCPGGCHTGRRAESLAAFMSLLLATYWGETVAGAGGFPSVSTSAQQGWGQVIVEESAPTARTPMVPK